MYQSMFRIVNNFFDKLLMDKLFSGYHWDCSDWALVNDGESRNQTPCGHRLSQCRHDHGHDQNGHDQMDNDDLESVSSSVAHSVRSHHRPINHHHNSSTIPNHHLRPQHRPTLDGLSVTEHRDSESNSDNSQVSAMEMQLLIESSLPTEQLNQSRNRKGFVATTSFGTNVRTSLTDSVASIENGSNCSLNMSSRRSSNQRPTAIQQHQETFKEEDEILEPIETSALLGHDLDDIDFVDDSPTSPTGSSKKYTQPHPNSYLPVMDLDSSNEMDAFNSVVGQWVQSSGSASGTSTSTMSPNPDRSSSTPPRKVNGDKRSPSDQIKSSTIDKVLKKKAAESNESSDQESTFV